MVVLVAGITTVPVAFAVVCIIVPKFNDVVPTAIVMGIKSCAEALAFALSDPKELCALILLAKHINDKPIKIFNFLIFLYLHFFKLPTEGSLK